MTIPRLCPRHSRPGKRSSGRTSFLRVGLPLRSTPTERKDSLHSWFPSYLNLQGSLINHYLCPVQTVDIHAYIPCSFSEVGVLEVLAQFSQACLLLISCCKGSSNSMMISHSRNRMTLATQKERQEAMRLYLRAKAAEAGQQEPIVNRELANDISLNIGIMVG